MWCLLLGIMLQVGHAEPTESVDTSVPIEPAVAPIPSDDDESLKWSGVVIGYPSGSSIDGLGLGIGGQVFSRPKNQSQGFKHSLILSLYANLRFDYTHNFLRFQSTGRTSWLGQIGYSGWRNLVYTGNGGQGTLLNRPDREAGNTLATPFASVAINRRLGTKGWSFIGQHSLRYVYSVAAGKSFGRGFAPWLRQKYLRRPFCRRIVRQHRPMAPTPQRLDCRSQYTWGCHRVRGHCPPDGLHSVSRVRWQPLWSSRLILGLRLYGERAFGDRPFYEKDRSGLAWRDVYGEEQLLVGYGKNRPRGDGTVAAALELRAEVAHHPGKFWDIEAYVSVFVEEAWLWDDNTPGPHLPTVGVAPFILFQQAIILRPYLAWGWRADSMTDPRTPRPQFGLVLTDAL